MKSFAVIGLGLFGTQLAKELYADGHIVLAIDKRENVVEKIADEVTQAVCCDAKNKETLEKLKIDKYDCVIVCTSTDLATSVIVTMNLKSLNVSNIICKVQNETDHEVLQTLGASQCIIPEHVAAINLSKRLDSYHVTDFMQLSEEHGIIEMTIPESWVNKSILELNIRSVYGINIIGIKNEGKLSVNFDASYVLKGSDELVVVGSTKSLSKLEKLK